MGKKVRFVWGNNEKRAQLKGRIGRIIARGRMGSVCVAWDDGGGDIVSRRSLRAVEMAADG